MEPESGAAAGSDATGRPGRAFRVGSEEWIAFAEGQGIAGSDAIADRAIQIVGFARATEPHRIVSRVVTSLRSLDDLFDEELASLLAAAQTVIEPDPDADRNVTRSGRRRRGEGSLEG